MVSAVMSFNDGIVQHHTEFYKNTVENGGDPGVLSMLGHMYFYGTRGLRQDFTAAAEMFHLAESLVSSCIMLVTCASVGCGLG